MCKADCFRVQSIFKMSRQKLVFKKQVFAGIWYNYSNAFGKTSVPLQGNFTRTDNAVPEGPLVVLPSCSGGGDSSSNTSLPV